MVIVSLVVAQWCVGASTMALSTSLLSGRTKVGQADKAHHPGAEALRSVADQDLHRSGQEPTTLLTPPPNAAVEPKRILRTRRLQQLFYRS